MTTTSNNLILIFIIIIYVLYIVSLFILHHEMLFLYISSGFFSNCNLGIWSKCSLRIHHGNKCIGSAIITTTASKRFYTFQPCNKIYKTTVREYLYYIINCRKNNCSPASKYLSIYTKTRIGF